jgi:diguanylate cyclase (GGDEF)-like protein
MSLTYTVTHDYLEEQLKESYFQKLISIRESKKNQIEHYFEDIQNRLSTLAMMPYTKQASIDIINSYNTEKLDEIIKRYDKIFNNYISKNGFDDLIIIDIKSDNIVYTAQKASDFSTNILTGISKNTNLNRLYQDIKKSPESSKVKMVDFANYSPIDGKPVSFFATTIYDHSYQPIAILAVEVSIDKIDSIMTANQEWKQEGLGESGETYIIGSDCTMRNNSRFFIENRQEYLKKVAKKSLSEDEIARIKYHNSTILIQGIDDEICQDILSLKRGQKIFKDYRGTEVLSAHTHLDIDGVHWAILSEIDKEEAYKIFDAINSRVYTILFAIFIITISMTILFSKTITKPLDILTKAVKDVGKGDFSKRVEIECSDEIGELANCFNSSLDELEKMTSSAEHFSKLSMTDNLTQLYNRVKLHQDLDSEIKRMNRTHSHLSLIMFDIDHFKKINDTHGHDVGDITLQDLANIVKSSIRETDILARWGGEEFMILLPDTSLDSAKDVASKIRANINAYRFETIGSLTCSFGVSEYKYIDTKETLLKRVDQALYSAKENGRDRVESM